MLDELIVAKLQFLREVPLFDALVQGESPHPVAQNLLIRNYTLCYHMLKAWSLYLTCVWIGTGSWQMDRQNY